VLGALLVETRQRRAGAPVLTLLAVAGLWRPEAWLFSAAYWAWAARGRPRAQSVRLAALAVAAPAAWLLGDLVLAGEPLHSFTWTREQAAALGRARGVGALRGALPDKLAHAAGLPVLIAGTAGLALVLRRRAAAGGGLAAAALGGSLVTAVALTAAGMPIVERYLLLPIVLLIVLAAGAAAESCTSLAVRLAPAITGDSPGYPCRRGQATALAAATVLALLAASLPARLGGVSAQRDRLAAQSALRADLRALANRDALPARCARIAVSNHKLIPLLALWTGRPPASFAAGSAVSAAEAYVEPATAAAERTLLFASSDPPEAWPAPPPGAAEVARDHSWRVQARC
jgi:sorbitol-specific phosphotransferase system component IIC